MIQIADPISLFKEALSKGPLSNKARPVKVPIEVGLDRALKSAAQVVRSPLVSRYFGMDNGFYLFQIEWEQED